MNWAFHTNQPFIKLANTPKYREFKYFNYSKTNYLVKDCPSPKKAGIYNLEELVDKGISKDLGSKADVESYSELENE